MKKKNQRNNDKHFIVNRKIVLNCLKYLCEHNLLYISNGINIDYQNVEKLPEDGFIQDLQEIIDKDSNCSKQEDIDEGPQILENSFEEHFEV